MKTFNASQSGFTLVELAIVITIIGLLIGGVLKGQELLENARMTSSIAQLKSFSTATLTFKDIYKALPGDIKDPGNFLQNCTASPCNISGNADGAVGPVYTGSGSFYNDENNNFWLHMAKAGLLAGIDPSMTWTSGTYFKAGVPDWKIGGKVYVATYNEGAAIHGLYNKILWVSAQSNASGASTAYAVPLNSFGKIDLKADDGKPWSGIYFVNGGGCGIAVTDLSYDPNNNNPCAYSMDTEF